MYAEHNDSEDPNRDWEFSVEFYPEEQTEYNFYVSTSEGEVEVCAEVQQQIAKTSGRKARAGKRIHKRVLLRTCY